MRLNAYLRADLVVTGLEAVDRAGVIETLADHLAARGVVPSAPDVARALEAREAVHTTVLGEGVAVPHATVEGTDPVLMVALAREPVRFGPEGTEPVRVFFLLLSRPGHESQHIKLLARICRLARHPGFLDELHAAADAERAVEIIRRVDEQHV